MVVDALTLLSSPIEARSGVPLRASVYSRVAEAIRSGALAPGSLVPSESELGAGMGVSRTVVREAILLLEEDGLVRSRRGIGRFVADRAPRIGLERLRPPEEVLARPDAPASVTRTEHTLQEAATDFVRDGLSLNTGEPTWFWESILSRAGEPIALIQEHVPAGERLASFGDEIAGIVEADTRTELSLLARLMEERKEPLGAAETEVGAGVPGAARGRLLRLRPSDPVLVLTQTVAIGGRPFYLAKLLLSTRAGQLSIRHSGG